MLRYFPPHSLYVHGAYHDRDVNAARNILFAGLERQAPAVEIPVLQGGLKSGDVILEVGGTKVANAADIRKAVGVAQKNGKHAVVMRVKSDDKTKFVAIPIARA